VNIKILDNGTTIVKRAFRGAKPISALILGSGWSHVTEAFESKRSLDYGDIPCLGSPQVTGHPGRLVLGETAGAELLIFEGRRHWYEGQGWEPVAFPIHLAISFGVKIVVLTNTAGGIRRDLRPGRLMVMDDHINAMGVNPLVGRHEAFWGPRFPDQREVYDRRLRRQLHATAQRIGQELSHGVYIAVSGPTYETPAEIAAFRSMGADAVGMSTVPEALLAHAAGLRVAGISCISNRAAGRTRPTTTHEAVLAETRKIQPRIQALLSAFLKDVAS